MRRLFSIAFVLLALVVATLKVAEWTTEEWWMNSLVYSSAQALYWQWRVEAFIPAFGLWLMVMVTNARLAWHNARWRDVSLPLLGPRSLAGRNQISPDDRRRLDVLARRGEQVFIGMSALMCGMAAANQFDLWVLALHPPAFGPGNDATFLVGVWPALLWGWNAFGTLLGFTVGLVITIAAFEGVLDFDTHGLRVGDATARHLAFLVGLIIMWVGVRCGLAALGAGVNFGWSANGISGFYEQSFTNPMRFVFLLSSPILAFWFARTAPRHTLRALVAAVFWSGCALFLPLMAPSLGRALRPPTSPEIAKMLRDEQEQHIAITRRAWGLNSVQQHQMNLGTADFSISPTLPVPSTAPLEKTPGLVVWPQEALRGALHANDTGGGLGASGQGRRPSEIYFQRVGRTLKARIIEADPAATSATSPLLWESDPTRGGEVVATRRELQAVLMQSPQVRNATFTRNPGMDPTDDGSIQPLQARVRELKNKEPGGVPRTGALTKLMLALRFGDQSLLKGDTPLTWHLDPLERVQTLAPFVWWTDAQPHPVWMRMGSEKLERMYWLVEGCFISRSFPHSAMMPAGDEWSNVNYARQSVLGVCDATTGQTNFYLFDPSEPLARAWNALLPNFFRPACELPDALRTGTRLSAALLSAQSVMWARYHPAASDQDEVATWKKGTDQWQQFDVFDSSERDAVAQPVVVERKGQPEMELMAAFSHWGGTVTDSTVPASGTNPASQLTLVALLGARDEGDAIWKGHGQTPLSAWRAAQPFAVPLSESPPEEPPLSPFLPEFFDKLALVPLLDAKGDCVGMQISRGRAERKRIKGGATPWTLANGVASTKIQFVAPSSAPSPVQERENMLRLRTLWKSWKEARANGRWERVEKLEGQINQLLAP